jgi:xanthine dehydrogenase accessory factor
MPRSFFHELCAASQSSVSFALGIISGVKGSSPQKQGAKAIFFEDGRMLGTLGGGCLEAEVRQRAFACLRESQGTHFDLVLDHDFGWDDGLICGGKVSCVIVPQPAALDLWQTLALRESAATWGVRPDYTVGLAGDEEAMIYRETVTPPEHLWIAGAGHVARAVAPLAEQLDFAVTIFDDRPALADPRHFPAGTTLRVDYWDKLLSQSPPAAPALGLILTRGHQHDAFVLSKWVRHPFAFLGMIGSKRKKSMIFHHFIQEGLATEEQLARVVCPVGLPIGGSSLPEIAVSIVAQLVQNRAERRPSKRPPVPADR